MVFKHFNDMTQWHQGCLVEPLEAASGMPKRQCDFTIIVLVDGLKADWLILLVLLQGR